MQTDTLLEALGYDDSPNCLRGQSLLHARELAHLFRRAREKSSLEASYCLTQRSEVGEPQSLTPVTYVCRAGSIEDADEIHKRVWNQDVVPFVIVLADQGVRVYNGFEQSRVRASDNNANVLAECDLDRAATALKAWSSSSIDSGEVWSTWGSRLQPRRRVEWRLLKDLQRLELLLRRNGLENAEVLHALIGRFVYLYYLRHRGFLSNDRLALWNLSWDQAASRDAKLNAFIQLSNELEERLNGAVFPLSNNQLRTTVGAELLRLVASVFAGDSVAGQMRFDFAAYDFSHIPVETLSVIYEQFLHLRPSDTGTSAGKDKAAYYTPIPVVNFIIDRMEEVRPLRRGMKVLDFACGSGAFLVQCYRKLIEDSWRTSKNKKPTPVELRALLTDHVFGLDVDGEACRVAELSLILTLLDYCEPPDLLTSNGKDQAFRLPQLSGANIVEVNAFDDANLQIRAFKKRRFDWIIGNPPWKGIKSKTTNPADKIVLNWINKYKNFCPTGGNEAAEAFAWRTKDFAADGALAGLLVPAMSLFKDESQAFRQEFFRRTRFEYVANFANLAEVLFARRSRVPAAAFIFHPRIDADSDRRGTRFPVFAPLVANQETTRPRIVGSRIDTWTIAVNVSEIRTIEVADAKYGGSLPWKIASWGSVLDKRLLTRMARLTKIGQWADGVGLRTSQGFELRKRSHLRPELLEHHPELEGRPRLRTGKLERQGRIYSFPKAAIEPVPSDETYVRKRGGFALPEAVCRPPHVVVGAAGNWAIFTNSYLIVPPRQIGIAGKAKDASVLMALALYCNSHFFRYYEFFTAPQFGVYKARTTLDTVRNTPIPKAIVDGDSSEIDEWAVLYEQLVAADRNPAANEVRRLLRLTNDRVASALGLSAIEATRVHEFVDVMLGLRDGKVEPRAVGQPNETAIGAYAKTLKRYLDAFVTEENTSHAVEIWHDDTHGLIRVQLNGRQGGVRIRSGTNAVSKVLRGVVGLQSELETRFSQWRYFNRNLSIFADDRVYVLKPMQRFHWIKSQAVADASDLIGLVLMHGQGAKAQRLT